MNPASDIFGRAGPRWFTIPSGRCFLDDLALGLCRALDGQLEQATILMPTRRGARAMARAFSHQARGKPLLLPQIRAIGDLDEGEPPFDLDALGLDLPPALSPVRRRFELARLIAEKYTGIPNISGRLALELADSLARFFDSLALEEIDAEDKLDRLVHNEGEDQYSLGTWAEHWQLSARFLEIAVREWPRRLQVLGAMDPSQRQVALIRRLVEQWRGNPPGTPLILAGTTGSAPSTADMADVVANARMGAVVLPGLDLSLAEDAWKQIEESHPQSTLKRLIDRHKVPRAEVQVWPASRDGDDRRARSRRRLLNEALRPAEATKDWLAQIDILKHEGDHTIKEGLEGLYEIDTARDEDAASVIALLMREALETPDKTVALVTPDLSLSRRVSARLSRWGLVADASGGEPLFSSLTGRFLHDLVGLVIEPHDPVLLLSLWRNPLCRFAEDQALSDVEKYGLRGARPNGLDTIEARLKAADKIHPNAIGLWADYRDAITPILDQPFTNFGASLTLFSIVAQSLARDADALWAGAAGSLASSLIAELMHEGADYRIASPREFADILTHILRDAKVRTGGNTHPRLQILGAIEARIIKADRIILAGLEEGVWPQAPDIDPFLSRPMRKKLGLPTPERRVGLSAHDFLQAAASPEAYLITRRRREGEPQVQSRWLWRLRTLCEGAHETVPTRTEVQDWSRALDCGLKDKPASLRPARQPDPKPPVEARPDSLSVTEVEVFVRDPYAIYAKKVLGLRTMDRPNEPVEARQRGTAIHASLEQFVENDTPLGEEGVRRLTGLLESELANTHYSPAQLELQKPLLPTMARKYVEFEAERRAAKPKLLIEGAGEIAFNVRGRKFTLKARADRLEVRDDAVDIVDFKTGYPASLKQVLAGFYPQLTLTAAILRHGGFKGISGKEVGDMMYVRVASDQVTPRGVYEKGVPNADLAEAALTSLKRRLEIYMDPDMGYRSWIAPQFLKNRGGDYDQLARLYEWHVLGEDDAGDGGEDGGDA